MIASWSGALAHLRPRVRVDDSARTRRTTRTSARADVISTAEVLRTRRATTRARSRVTRSTRRATKKNAKNYGKNRCFRAGHILACTFARESRTSRVQDNAQKEFAKSNNARYVCHIIIRSTVRPWSDFPFPVSEGTRMAKARKSKTKTAKKTAKRGAAKKRGGKKK
ncbi:MAG: hypothetical protein H0V44_13625 [Planctomycetes bacterium]|nr:hypothetical protein [Planctomycetota bacterium]